MVHGKELEIIGSDQILVDITITCRGYKALTAADNPCQCSLASFKLARYLRHLFLGRVSNGKRIQKTFLLNCRL